MLKVKNQFGFALMEGILVIFLAAVIVAAGVYVKNRHNDNQAKSQPAAVSADYKKIATDPAKEGTVTGIEAAVNGSANDEVQAEQQSESSQSSTASNDGADSSSVGGSVDENAINF